MCMTDIVVCYDLFSHRVSFWPTFALFTLDGFCVFVSATLDGSVCLCQSHSGRVCVFLCGSHSGRVLCVFVWESLWTSSVFLCQNHSGRFCVFLCQSHTGRVLCFFVWASHWVCVWIGPEC